MAFEEMNDKKYKEMILEQEEFEYEMMVMEREGKPTEVFESYDGELIKFRGNERNISIPHYITSIRDQVFLGCHNLESVKFGKNVEYIGAECFVNCENLHSVTIPENVKYIFPKVFGYSVTVFTAAIISAESSQKTTGLRSAEREALPPSATQRKTD